MKPPPPDHVADPVSRRGVLTGPNALTVLRLVLVPVFIVLMLPPASTADRWWAAVVFVIASLTDVVDGVWARRTNQVTTFGKIADPIADKALTGAALVLLSVLGDLWWWITAVIIVRELGVTALRFWVIRHGVIPASRGGKAKTIAQMIAITLYVVPLQIPVIAPVAMAVAVVLTVVTGIDYVARAVALRRRGRAAR